MAISKATVTSLGGYQTFIEGNDLVFYVEDNYLHIETEDGAAVAAFIPGAWREVQLYHAEGVA